MKSSNFDSSAPNRSGIRPVSRSAKKFSGSMFQGLGRAIDRARLVSSSSTYIRETPGGSSVEVYDSSETLTPFRVDALAFRNGKIWFRLEEGRVFGAAQSSGGSTLQPFSVNEESYRVGFDSTVTPISELASVPIPNVLDNRNNYTFEANIAAGQDTVIFIAISRSSGAAPWSVKLKVKSREDAESESAVDPITCESMGEVDLGASSHGFPSTLEAPVLFGTSIVLTQGAKLFEAYSAFVGSALIPIAFVRKDDLGDYKVFQVLRSDIFFPYAAKIVFRYIDTGVTDLEGSDTEPPE
jgi:hypothetical protein